MTGKEKALKWIAEQSAAICNHPDVFSCTWIAKDIGEPVRKVRKYMKELEAEGYVKKAHEYGYTGDLEDTLDALGYTAEEINADERLLRGLNKAADEIMAHDCF